jgi:CelD/BcsL family acetyltransferase involved in cellulose biosynthesis
LSGALATCAPAPSADRTTQCVNPAEVSDWDAMVATLPAVTFFHRAAWVRVLQIAYGFSPSFLVTKTDGKVSGVLPLVAVNSWLTGRRGISLPFTDECGLLAADDETRRQLLNELQVLAQKAGWRYWELRGATGDIIAEPASERYLGHRLSLSGSTTELFSRCEEATRRSVRKAERSPLKIEFSRSADALRAFHVLLCATRKRHGVPPQPRKFFEAIHRHIMDRGLGVVALARFEGKPVAGAVFFHHERQALYKYGASDLRFQQLRPNNLVMWRAIEWHVQHGFQILDFGRTSVGNDGLRRFKLGWGAVERMIRYVRFDCRTGAFVAPVAHAARWRAALFRHLPVAVSRLIGAIAYRHAA